MNIADIVISLNGRDAGHRFVVIETEDNYAVIADGKRRKLERPKRKKIKHLKPEGKANGIAGEKLKNGEKITNSELRKELAAYDNTESADTEEKGGVPKCQKTT